MAACALKLEPGQDAPLRPSSVAAFNREDA